MIQPAWLQYFENEDPIETERTTGYVSDLVLKANGRFDGAKISIGRIGGQPMVE